MNVEGLLRKSCTWSKSTYSQQILGELRGSGNEPSRYSVVLHYTWFHNTTIAVWPEVHWILWILWITKLFILLFSFLVQVQERRKVKTGLKHVTRESQQQKYITADIPKQQKWEGDNYAEEKRERDSNKQEQGSDVWERKEELRHEPEENSTHSEGNMSATTPTFKNRMSQSCALRKTVQALPKTPEKLQALLSREVWWHLQQEVTLMMSPVSWRWQAMAWLS